MTLDWTTEQKMEYINTACEETLQIKGHTVKYAPLSFGLCKYQFFNSEGEIESCGATASPYPEDFFKMMIYAKLGIDFWRKCPRGGFVKGGERRCFKTKKFYVFED